MKLLVETMEERGRGGGGDDIKESVNQERMKAHALLICTSWKGDDKGWEIVLHVFVSFCNNA